MANWIETLKYKKDERERKRRLEDDFILDKEVRRIQGIVNELTRQIDDWYDKARAAKKSGMSDIYQKYVDKIFVTQNDRLELETVLTNVELARDDSRRNISFRRMTESLSRLGGVLSTSGVEGLKNQSWKKKYANLFDQLSTMQERGNQSTKTVPEEWTGKSLYATKEDIEKRILGMEQPEPTADILKLIDEKLGESS